MNLVEYFMSIKGVEVHEAIVIKDDFLESVRLQLRDNNLEEACNICDENCIEIGDIIELL